MSWHFDKDNHCSYEQWAKKAGGLIWFLENFCLQNNFNIVWEFGTGNSTRVLAKRCKEVVTIDNNKDSIIVPVMEQGPSGLDRALWNGLKKEDNVTFICDDVFQMDFRKLQSLKKPDMILFDLGILGDDKWMYIICYERLKANNLLDDHMVLAADNSNEPWAIKFGQYLENYEGYKITNYPETGQFVARKEVK